MNEQIGRPANERVLAVLKSRATYLNCLTSLFNLDRYFLNRSNYVLTSQRRESMHSRKQRRITRRFLVNLVCLVAVVAFTGKEVFADEISVWHFNDSESNVDHGNGTLTTNCNLVNVLFAAGTTNNARLGDLAGQALSLQGGTGNATNCGDHTLN